MKKNATIFLIVISFFQQRVFPQDSSVRHALQFSSREINRVSIDSFYEYRFNVTGSSNKPVSFALQSLPTWLYYDPATHIISGKPLKAGPYPVHFTAFNGDTSVNQQFMLVVYNSNTTNILCLGNSITNGTAKYNSYRRALWHMLNKRKYNVDFVGSWSSHHMGGKVPNPDFDMDHDGHSGWTAADVLTPPDWDKQRGNISQWLQAFSPDIVLIELGTNEIFQCIPVADALKSLSTIIDILRKKNSAIKIFLAQIPPLGKQWATKKLCGNDTAYAQRVITFNKALKNFSINKNSIASRVIIVDQYKGIDPAIHMYDDIHPNDSGEKIMAERWFKAIRPYLNKLN